MIQGGTRDCWGFAEFFRKIWVLEVAEVKLVESSCSEGVTSDF